MSRDKKTRTTSNLGTYKVVKSKETAYAVCTPSGHIIQDSISCFPFYAQDRWRWYKWWHQHPLKRWLGCNKAKPWAYWEQLGYTVVEIEIRSFEIRQRGTKQPIEAPKQVTREEYNEEHDTSMPKKVSLTQNLHDSAKDLGLDPNTLRQLEQLNKSKWDEEEEDEE